MLQRMIGAALFNAHTYEEVEADQSALGQAIGVVILVTICGVIGGLVGGIIGDATAKDIILGLCYGLAFGIVPLGVVGDRNIDGRWRVAAVLRHPDELVGSWSGPGVCLYPRCSSHFLLGAGCWLAVFGSRLFLDYGRSGNGCSPGHGLRGHRPGHPGGCYSRRHWFHPLDNPWNHSVASVELGPAQGKACASLEYRARY